MLEAFIAQFYDDKPPPPLLLTSHALPQSELVAEALCLKAHRKVEITTPQRGEKRAVVEHAVTNAREALERRLAEGAGQAKLLDGVAQLFELGARPSGSSATTTATSWAPTRMASWWCSGRRGRTRTPTASSASAAPSCPATTSP